MIRERDYIVLQKLGISENKLYMQLENFRKGFDAAKIVKPALVDDGIILLSDSKLKDYVELWNLNKEKYVIVKFVPASGAASRMFKELFEFREAYSPDKYADLMLRKDFGSIHYFFKHLDEFPFWNELRDKYAETNGVAIEEDLLRKNFVQILNFILDEKGLNFGFLPKGLIHFHRYASEVRKAFDEHFVEAAQYADSGNKAFLHFTVSPEHQNLFEQRVNLVKEHFQQTFGLHYMVGFSNQEHSTDTVAATPDNQIFRDEKGDMLFRPGGHGALIQNLNNIDADIIFIKNIDNVAPDHLKAKTIDYKKALAGLLIYFKEKIHYYIAQLEEVETLEDEMMEEIGLFLVQNLCILPSMQFKPQNRLERIRYLYNKLNRPIRVCGMVKNEGEPGGGPFWTENADGSVSLQIVESAQIDLKNQEVKEIFAASTHFNPVDIVCYVKDFEGIKFDLTQYVDPATGFIAEKSYAGRKLKAMELPGLWNGAMADWITIFMEVPIDSFTPVKTVQDLLRPQHKA
jgi:hypothetical protein